MALAIDTLLKRQKEVFEVFIASNGREVSLLPLVQKYKKENEGETEELVSFPKVYDYLRMYIQSDNITPEEREVYEKVTTMSDALKIRRGEEIVRLLIENRCRWNEVSILAKKYAQQDGKIKSYSSETMKEWRKLFLLAHKDSELVTHYRKVLELSRNRSTQGYDLLLLDKIVDSVDLTSAIQFIQMIKISRKSLTDLFSAYKVVYPTKKAEHEFLEKCIEGAFEKKPANQKFTDNPYVAEKKMQKIINFKGLLEEFTISDEEKIESLFAKYNFTRYGFNETLKDLRATNDKVLQLLIDQYDLKLSAIHARIKSELETILGYLLNGICYGQEYHKFNYYDLRTITTMSEADIVKYAIKLLPRGEAERIRIFINAHTSSRVYKTAQELVEAVNYGHPDRMATDEEKWAVAEYMKSLGWPYSVQLFSDTLSRYMNNDIIITETVPEDEENELRMNK